MQQLTTVETTETAKFSHILYLFCYDAIDYVKHVYRCKAATYLHLIESQ